MESVGARSTYEGNEGETFNAARHVVSAPASTTQPARESWLDVHVENLDAIPASGGAIIAANQLPTLDPSMLSTILGRQVVVPEATDGSLHAARNALLAGHLVALVPEGRRTRTRRRGPGHSGVAHLALTTGSPIIPVGINGADAIAPEGQRTLRRSPLAVRIGATIHPGSTGARPTMRTRLALSHDVMCAVAALSGREVEARPDHLVQV